MFHTAEKAIAILLHFLSIPEDLKSLRMFFIVVCAVFFSYLC